MELFSQDEPDALASLELRIQKAVELVSRYRDERDALQQQLSAALADKEAALQQAQAARAETGRLAEELQSLRAEQKQVRGRIQKLLGQMDALSSV